jgi:hypothetical protein
MQQHRRSRFSTLRIAALTVAVGLAPSAARAQQAHSAPLDIIDPASSVRLRATLSALAVPTVRGAAASENQALRAAPVRLGGALQPTTPNGERDSLKNGAVIGAIAGAAALGGFGLFLCHALDDTGGDPDCFPEALYIAALGGGIGLGAGLAVDALLARHPQPAVGVRLTVRPRSTRSRR